MGFFLHIKSLPNLLFGVLCLTGDQSHPFAQPTINPLACCICWAGLFGRAVFPPWNEGPNLGSYTFTFIKRLFSSSLLSAIRVESSAYLRLLIFLPAILIPACASSRPASLLAGEREAETGQGMDRNGNRFEKTLDSRINKAWKLDRCGSGVRLIKRNSTRFSNTL